MDTSTTQAPEGPDWLSLKPAHFDTSLLPRKHRKPDPGALFTVADLVTVTPKAPQPCEMDGQADLFSEAGL